MNRPWNKGQSTSMASTEADIRWSCVWGGERGQCWDKTVHASFAFHFHGIWRSFFFVSFVFDLWYTLPLKLLSPLLRELGPLEELECRWELVFVNQVSMPGFVVLELQSTPFHETLVLQSKVHESITKYDSGSDRNWRLKRDQCKAMTVTNSLSSASKPY